MVGALNCNGSMVRISSVKPEIMDPRLSKVDLLIF